MSTNTTTTSKAGPCSSWSSTLYSVLSSVPYPISLDETYKNFNSRHNRHPPGLIWKQTLGHCVFHDLSDEETMGSPVRQRRRFARLESMGLSGVILFEIPAGRAEGDGSPAAQDKSLRARMTLKSIFGDPDDPNELGMNVNELLDCVNARVIYFPSYACTSFIMGQVMSAFFQREPRIRPLPAREGFSVDAKAFGNSSFTIVESFALRSNESCSSLSLASLSSIPLIKVHPADDEDFFRNDCANVQLEDLASFPMPAYNLKASKYDKSRRYSRYIEDECKDELQAQLGQDLLLGGQSFCEADSPDSGGFVTSHPSILSLVLDDYHQMLSDEMSGDNMVDGIEKDEGNTSISTLDSGGPQTPPRSVSPDMEDESLLDKDIVTAQRRRPKALSLCDTGFTAKHAASGSVPDIHSALTTSSSIDFLLDAETEFSAEPLTPVMMNIPGILTDQDRTPTHIRTPMAKPTQSVIQAKIKSRAGLGKENIAPFTVKSRRG